MPLGRCAAARASASGCAFCGFLLVTAAIGSIHLILPAAIFLPWRCSRLVYRKLVQAVLDLQDPAGQQQEDNAHAA